MIVQHIPVGRTKAITRDKLRELTGLSDRKVRQEIRNAREAGVPIISSSHSAGYYIAETDSEKGVLLRELASRIGALAKTYRAVAKTIKPEGQMTFDSELSEFASEMVLYSSEYLEGVHYEHLY